MLEGDQTGQELLEQSLRVLDPELLGLALELERFDLSLENRRRTENGVCHEAAAAMADAGLGLKAATITPEGADDVGSPEPHDPRGDRRQGDRPHRSPHPRRHPGGGRPPPDLGLPDGGRRTPTAPRSGASSRDGDEVAYRTERIHRSICRAVAEYSFRTAEKIEGKVYGGPKWTVSPVYEGMLKEEMDAAAERHPEVAYEPRADRRHLRRPGHRAAPTRRW